MWESMWFRGLAYYWSWLYWDQIANFWSVQKYNLINIGVFNRGIENQCMHSKSLFEIMNNITVKWIY